MFTIIPSYHVIQEKNERDIGLSNLTSLLGDELDPSDLQSLLVEVYRRVAACRNVKELLSDYKSN
jgi:hypothetical protein